MRRFRGASVPPCGGWAVWRLGGQTLVVAAAGRPCGSGRSAMRRVGGAAAMVAVAHQWWRRHDCGGASVVPLPRGWPRGGGGGSVVRPLCVAVEMATGVGTAGGRCEAEPSAVAELMSAYLAGDHNHY